MGQIGREFETLQLGVLPVANEPTDAASGVLWFPELDTARIQTVSGMRELRTGHGLIQVYRNVDAASQTFTTTATAVNFNLNPFIDTDYYEWDATSTVTIRHPGLYQISYTLNVDVNTGTARSSNRTDVTMNGSLIAWSEAVGYNRTANNGFSGAGKSFIVHVTSANSTIQARSVRIAGTDTLEFIRGCDISIQRIGPPRITGGD